MSKREIETATGKIKAWDRRVPDPMVPVLFKVGEVNQELGDTFTLRLEPAERDNSFDFKPGQFAMLYRFGVGEVPISISGDPAISNSLTHTIRAVGTVTNALHRLEPGEVVGIRGPFGSSWPVEAMEGEDVVIVTGGIGLAPLRPVIYHLLANRSHYGAVCIYYGARNPNEILYRKQLEQWRGRFDLTVNVTVDSAGADWNGRVGVVTKLLGQNDFDPYNTVALICGPEVMIRHSIYTLNGLGVQNNQIHISMERNMKCAVGFCGHCQFGSAFVCKDGPVFRFDRIADHFKVQEL